MFCWFRLVCFGLQSVPLELNASAYNAVVNITCGKIAHRLASWLDGDREHAIGPCCKGRLIMQWHKTTFMWWESTWWPHVMNCLHWNEISHTNWLHLMHLHWLIQILCTPGHKIVDLSRAPRCTDVLRVVMKCVVSSKMSVQVAVPATVSSFAI